MYKKKGTGRRTELIATAASLFFTKGYENVSIDEIIQTEKIAKGTFYYYFTSKEELLGAVISYVIEQGLMQTKEIVKNNLLSPEEKLIGVIAAVNQESKQTTDVMQELHQTTNSRIHQKISVETVKNLAPLIAEIFKQGIELGIYQTPYPEECAEIFLAAAKFLLDDSYCFWTQEEKEKRIRGLLYVMKSALHAPEDAFRVFETALIK